MQWNSTQQSKETNSRRFQKHGLNWKGLGCENRTEVNVICFHLYVEYRKTTKRVWYKTIAASYPQISEIQEGKVGEGGREERKQGENTRKYGEC